MPFARPVQPLRLSLNENPLAPSPMVEAAVAAEVPHLNFYPTHGRELEAELAAYLGHGLTEQNITLGHGGSEVLKRVAAAYIQPGDEAVIPVPTFPVYAADVGRRGGVPVLTECHDDFTVDVEALLGQVTSKTRLMYITSPNNPSGAVLPQNELDYLVSKLPDHVFLLFDEVYWHFGAQPHRARAYRHLERQNIMILHSFSKAFGLAGLRLGYGIAHATTTSDFLRFEPAMRHNRLLTAAGAAALRDTAHVTRAVELVQSQRTYLYEGLAALLGVTQVLRSEASFVPFRPAGSSTGIARELEARNVFVRELSAFHMPGWLRVSVGLPAANECFLAALQDVLEHRPIVE